MGECHHRDIYDHPDGDGAECGYPLPCPHHGMRGALVWEPEELSWIDEIELQRSARAAHEGEMHGPARRISTPAGKGMRSWCYFWPDGEITSDGVARDLPEEDGEARWWADDKRWPPSPHHEPPRTNGSTITLEQARNVLVALAEEGLTVDSEGFCVPLDPEEFGVVPDCDEPDCEGVGEVIDGPRILCRECAPKVDDATIEMFDPFEELRRMGEEARAAPLSAEVESMLDGIKAAVRRKLGEP